MTSRDSTGPANRTGLTLLALLAIAAGGYGLARSLGAFGSGRARSNVFDEDVLGFYRDNDQWIWVAAAALALLLAYLGYRWLKAQLPASRPDPILLSDHGEQGTTEVPAKAAAAAFADDLRRHPAIRGASARIETMDDDSYLARVKADVDDDVDVDEIRRFVSEDALVRLQEVLETDSIRGEIDLRFAGEPERTVR